MPLKDPPEVACDVEVKGAHRSRVDPIRNVDCVAGVRFSRPRELDPHLQVRKAALIGVEPADLTYQRCLREHARWSSWDSSPSCKHLAQMIGGGHGNEPDHSQLLIDEYHAGIREVGSARYGGVYLFAQFPRCPQVIVVEERDPLASGSCDPGIA